MRQVTDKFEHIILYQVHNFIGWYLIAMNLQWKFELILTCNKAAIDNLKKKKIATGYLEWKAEPLDIILKEDHPSQLWFKFGSEFSDLNLKAYKA